MKSKRNRLLHSDSDSDPMGTVANLFDVAMVFAVALMVALVSRFNMTEMFSKEDFTMVKNPGKENMEIITKEGQEIKKYTPSEDPKTSGKRGKKVGVAYQLENGEIIEISDDVICNYTVIKDSELKTHILYDKYTDGITNSIYYVVDMIKKFFRNLKKKRQ